LENRTSFLEQWKDTIDTLIDSIQSTLSDIWDMLTDHEARITILETTTTTTSTTTSTTTTTTSTTTSTTLPCLQEREECDIANDRCCPGLECTRRCKRWFRAKCMEWEEVCI
jgi:hypothetical protein